MAFNATTGANDALASGATTPKVLAKALGLNSSAAAAGDEFTLGLQQKGFIRDFLNRNNPLSAYTQAIDVAETGAGSVTIKWDGADSDWVDKTTLGEGNIEEIKQRLEVLFWNKPAKKAEGLSAYDLKKGALNTLAYRMEKSMTKYIQGSIKRGFAKMGAALTAITQLTVATNKVDGQASIAQINTASDDSKKIAQTIIMGATNFITKRQLSRDQVIITIDPLTFDRVALAGLVGDRTTVTYSAGQYSVGTLGGYRIQSGEMFLPSSVTVQLPGASAGTTTAAPLTAIIAPTNSVVSKVDVIAANYGKLGVTNDNVTYIELADINEIPTYIKENGLIAAIVDTP